MTDYAGPQSLFKNRLSRAGAVIAIINWLLIAGALAASPWVDPSRPHWPLYAYVLFPTLAFGGVGLVLLGAKLQRRNRLRDGLRASVLPDLKSPVHRRSLILSGLALAAFSIVLLASTVKAYEFTESTVFCGLTCHASMSPEYTAYTRSPHARVECVDCHVGDGFEYYVKSKMAGTRQLVNELRGNYERPIPVPVKSLRPARETCERCHWPQKFFGSKFVQIPHFRYDEKNTAEQISFVLKIGGGSRSGGEASGGIHFQMMIANKVSFVATDPQQQNIPWTEVRRGDGTVVEYSVPGFTKGSSPSAQVVQMDCMNCHNRPTHSFPAPDGAVDVALADGQVSAELPWAKKVLVGAIERSYPTRQEAHAGIRAEIRGFYEKQYPDFAKGKSAIVDQAIEASIAMYDRSVFPEMKLDWSTYPDDLSHRNWPGCFRCHDGRHVSRDGKVLSKDCSLCHTEPQRGPLMPLGKDVPKSDLAWHPWDIGPHLAIRGHEKVGCNACHSAGFIPHRECTECHNK